MSTAMPNRTTATWLFLTAAVVGCVLPLRYFVRFLLTEGLNLPLFVHLLFQNDVSAIFAMDVILSAMTLWLFVYIEGRRRDMKALWVYVLCTMLVGVSFALPLFLFMRERTDLRSREGAMS